MKTLTTLIAAALAATVSTAALAEPVSLTVRYSDLDLASADGQKALDRRIDQAARTVCGDQNGFVPLPTRVQISKCVTKATERAVAALPARQDIQTASR